MALWVAANDERRQLRTPVLARPDDSTSVRSIDGLKVSDVHNWIKLGVHAPLAELSTGEILSARIREGQLPEYVLREADRLMLRPALSEAASRETSMVTLVVILGESSAGKSQPHRASVSGRSGSMRQAMATR
jgi:hypothetical protein